MEEAKSTALALPAPTVVDEENASWEIQQRSNVAPAGYEIIRVPIPRDLTALSPLQKAIVMKSTKAWQGYDFPFLIYVQLWCAERGLNELAGDAYAVDGRISVSDDVKIRQMRNSGKVEWVKVTDPIEGKHPLTGAKDFYCEATIKHKDEAEPESYKAWFSEWNNPKNQNWQTRPVESLQRKALARLSQRMFPLGPDEDDFEPARFVETDLEKSLRAELLGKAIAPASFAAAHSKAPDLVDVTAEPPTAAPIEPQTTLT